MVHSPHRSHDTVPIRDCMVLAIDQRLDFRLRCGTLPEKPTFGNEAQASTTQH
jgi:hypothetical protein